MYFLLNHCQIAFEQHGGIMLTLFLAGLFGGITHCIGMCGPFVVAQVNNKGKATTSIQKMASATLLPYHLGRMTTYMLLGIIAAYLSKQIMGTPLQKGVSFAFLTIAGMIFITGAIPHIKTNLKILKIAGFATVGKILGTLTKPLFVNPNLFRSYVLGLLLGFLPCELIFASLMIVSTTGSIFAASIGMSIFTMGTFIPMLIIGLAGHITHNKWPAKTHAILRSVMFMNGFSLLFLAGNIFYK